MIVGFFILIVGAIGFIGVLCGSRLVGRIMMIVVRIRVVLYTISESLGLRSFYPHYTIVPKGCQGINYEIMALSVRVVHGQLCSHFFK